MKGLSSPHLVAVRAGDAQRTRMIMGITFIDYLRAKISADIITPRPAQIVAMAKLALSVRRERDQLAKLTPEQLADIGVHPKVAEREAERGVFDLPKHRLGKVK